MPDCDPDKWRNAASAIFKVAMDAAAKHGRGAIFHEIMIHLWLESTHNHVLNGTSFKTLAEYHRIEMKAEANRRKAH